MKKIVVNILPDTSRRVAEGIVNAGGGSTGDYEVITHIVDIVKERELQNQIVFVRDDGEERGEFRFVEYDFDTMVAAIGPPDRQSWEVRGEDKE